MFQIQSSRTIVHTENKKQIEEFCFTQTLQSGYEMVCTFFAKYQIYMGGVTFLSMTNFTIIMFPSIYKILYNM